ncbi:hypothetical protein TNCV_2724451 [Trichonephila clavipes]|nr:hypothetical protein TNCV_2724451 [Trichonephila clavipes]
MLAVYNDTCASKPTVTRALAQPGQAYKVVTEKLNMDTDISIKGNRHICDVVNYLNVSLGSVLKWFYEQPTAFFADEKLVTFLINSIPKRHE